MRACGTGAGAGSLGPARSACPVSSPPSAASTHPLPVPQCRMSLPATGLLYAGWVIEAMPWRLESRASHHEPACPAYGVQVASSSAVDRSAMPSRYILMLSGRCRTGLAVAAQAYCQLQARSGFLFNHAHLRSSCSRNFASSA